MIQKRKTMIGQLVMAAEELNLGNTRTLQVNYLNKMGFHSSSELNKICRICMRSDRVLSEIFSQAQTTNIADILTECTKYPVKYNDGLPNNICGVCKVAAFSAYHFKLECEESYRQLLLLAGGRDSKMTLPVNSESNNPGGNCEERATQTDPFMVNTCTHCKNQPQDHVAREVKEESNKNAKHKECQICRRQFSRKEHMLRHLAVIHKIIQNDDTEKELSGDSDKNVTDDLKLNYEIVAKEPYDTFEMEAEFKETAKNLLQDEHLNPISPTPTNLFTEVLLKQNAVSIMSHSALEDLDISLTSNQSESSESSQKCSDLLDKPLAAKRKRGRPPRNREHAEYNKNNENTIETLNVVATNKQQQDRSTVKSHKCVICQKSFTTHIYLIRHMGIHERKRYICKECTTGFLTKDELSAHVKEQGHDKPMLCPECGLRCKTSNILTVHMRRHKGEKPFKCKFCSKGFPRIDDLRIHEKYHTGEKSHFCETCGKGFQRKYNLTIHLRVHTGERPYKCPHCPQAFAQGNDLKSHIRRHTGERFRCEVCNAAFLQIYQIRQHKLQEHGIKEDPPTQRVAKFTSLEAQELQIKRNLQQELLKTSSKLHLEKTTAESTQATNDALLTTAPVISMSDTETYMDIT